MIDDIDLNHFEFDLDLTLTVFFMNADGEVYARYGGRDGTSPDARQSLEGLRYTMASVLDEHNSGRPRFAPRRDPARLLIHEVPSAQGRNRCLHCHQAKEIMHQELKREGKWSLDRAFRYPLPDNLGFRLEIDRGNVVERIEPGSVAERAGLLPNDRVFALNRIPIHSMADAQFALDAAPESGSIPVSWWRGDELRQADLKAEPGWRRSDISWRASLLSLVALPRLYGPDLTAEEKAAIGLPPDRLAFREQDAVSEQAGAAGVREGDIILGFNDVPLRMKAPEFARYVRRHYIAGETVRINVVRDGQPITIRMLLK